MIPFIYSIMNHHELHIEDIYTDIVFNHDKIHDNRIICLTDDLKFAVSHVYGTCCGTDPEWTSPSVDADDPDEYISDGSIRHIHTYELSSYSLVASHKFSIRNGSVPVILKGTTTMLFMQNGCNGIEVLDILTGVHRKILEGCLVREFGANNKFIVTANNNKLTVYDHDCTPVGSFYVPIPEEGRVSSIQFASDDTFLCVIEKITKRGNCGQGQINLVMNIDGIIRRLSVTTEYSTPVFLLENGKYIQVHRNGTYVIPENGKKIELGKYGFYSFIQSNNNIIFIGQYGGTYTAFRLSLS